jgi:hypothetical protein
MQPDLEVDTAEVRRSAGHVADTGARVAAGAAQAPAPVVVPRWDTAVAATALTDAAAGRLIALGGEVTATGRQISATADAYEQVDDRSAARLGATR